MYSLHLLGGLTLEGPSGPLSGRVAQRRRLALLALVGTAAERGLTRDKLAGFLWPEHEEASAKHLLSDSLYVLHKTLGDDSVLATGEFVRLNPAVVECDVLRFEKAIAADELETAVESYKGPFLDGFYLGSGANEFEQWVENERQRLADRYAQALQVVAERAEAAGDPQCAATWWKKLAAHEPYNSLVALRLMQALAAAGDPTGAIEFARTHERRLREDMGVSPAPEVLAFSAELRERARPSAGMSVASHAGTREAETAVPLAQTPDTVSGSPTISTRDKPRGTAKRHLRRLPVLGGAAAVSALVIGISTHIGLKQIRSPPDSNRVAVFPFSYRGSQEYAGFGTGIVHLLSYAIDGAGGLRVADPHLVLAISDRETEAVMDPERTLDLAARVGAGRAIVGEIVEVEGTLRMTAWMRGNDGVVARAAVEGIPGDLFRLVDQLTAQLAVGVIGEDGAQLAGIAARTTTSPEALKLFLKGESEFRANRFAASSRSLRQAVELDSTFALAWFRLAAAAIWSWEWDLAHDASERAVQCSQRLPPRERQLLMAWAAHMRGSPDEAERLYRAIVQGNPDDVEGWYGLGAVLYHHNSLRGRSLAEARLPFARALRYEPHHYRARALLMWTEAAEGRWPQADSLLRTFSPKPPLSWRAVSASARADRSALKQILAEADTASSRQIHEITTLVSWAATDPRDGLRFARLLARPTTESPGLRTLGLTTVAHLELVGGRLAAASAALDTLASVNLAWALEHGVLLAAAPFLEPQTDELEAFRDTLRLWNVDAVPASHDPFFYVNVHDGIHPHLRLYLLALTSARLGDRVAAQRYAEELEQLQAPPQAGTLPRDLAQGIRAQLAWIEGDTAETLAALAGAPRRVRFERAWTSPFYSQSAERYLRGRALEASGRYREALRWYATVSQHSIYDKIYLAPSHLRRAEIHQRLGQHEEAAEHYKRFIELWKDADSEFQPQVEKARRALAALPSVT